MTCCYSPVLPPSSRGIVMAPQACSERNATFARTCGIVLRMSLRDPRVSKAVQVAFVAMSALWLVNFSTQRLTVHSPTGDHGAASSATAKTKIQRGRDGSTRAADFRNTNQHLSGQNKTGRGGRQQISSAVLLTCKCLVGPG